MWCEGTTDLKPFNKRRKNAARAHATGSVFSCGLLIAGAFVLLLIVFVLRVLSPSPSPPEPVKERTETQPRRVQRTRTHTPPPVFDTEAYYRTIIENNLFRPLGWTPPRPTEPYRLIGTILPCRANTPPQTIIQSTAGNTTYILLVGEKIDANTEVVSIESKQVTLSRNGQKRTLRLPSGF